MPDHHDELSRLRSTIASLLDPAAPADALESYYALQHDARRTRLHVSLDSHDRADGFLAVCQTGQDLFRPLVVLRAPEEALDGLLQAGLSAGRPYFFIAPLALREALAARLPLVDVEAYRVYSLRQHEFRPVINILVQREAAPDGGQRWVIRESGGQAAAVAGINWRSTHWAEIYVHVDMRARGRGLGRSVVSACTSWLFDQGLQPLYLAAEGNTHSIALAEALGYRDARARKFTAAITGG
jgi:RimJ/RimL family protein N-acetyltransferase